LRHFCVTILNPTLGIYMQKIEVSKLSKVIANKEENDLKEINFAINEINQILQLERLRETQIKHKLNEVFKPSSISTLKTHLVNIQKNIEHLNIFLLMLKSKIQIEVSEKIDFSKATPISKFL